MRILDEIKDAISVLKLDKTKISSIAGRKSATLFGIIFIIVPPILNVLFSLMAFSSGFSSIFSRYLIWPIFIPALSYAATSFLMSFVAEKVFHGGKDHVGFFRIMAYASVAMWVTVVPFLFMFLGIMDAYGLFRLLYIVAGAWILYMAFHVLMEHSKLTKENAIFTIIAAIVISIIIESILANLLVGVGYRLY